MELKIPIEIVFDDVNSVIDELDKLQKYKLCEGDDMTLVDVDDVADVLTRHVMAREAKEPCGTKEEWIPCSERLPEKKQFLLVTVADEVSPYTSDDEWTGTGFWAYGKRVSAWRPLPKPYKEDTDD